MAVADPGFLDRGGGAPIWIGGASFEGGGARSNGRAVCGWK